MSKKIIATVFAIVLVLSMSVSAFAADPTGSITINAPESGSVSLEGKTYDAYQVLSATTDGAGNYAYYVTPEFAAMPELAGKTNTEIQTYINGMNASELAVFAKAAADYAIANNVPAASTVTGGTGATSVAINNLPYGYYVVSESGSGDVTAACALNTVTSDVVITLKADVPSIEKTIVDGEDLIKGTDVSIGDTVEFRLDSTVPDMTAYTDYTYIISDTMSAGLTFAPESITVTIDGTVYDYAAITAAGSAFTYNVNPDAPLTFTLGIDLLAMVAADADLVKGDAITVNYTADLNENAVIGGAGNPNTVDLTYSNNPYDTTTETTPESTVLVYSFELDGTKVDGTNQAPLAGAIFALYTTTPLGDTPDATVPGPNDTTVNLYLVEEGITSDAEGIFTTTGIEAGTYYLIETTAPSGYNKLDAPIVFTVTATYDETTGTLLNLVTDNAAVLANSATGVVSTTVANNAGTLLPSTGGIGTTIFTVVGLSLMIGAAVVLLLKKKASAK